MKRNILLIFHILIISSCIQKQKNVEIDFDKDGHFFVEAVIDDSIKGRFVFDTGASGLYLDETFIEQNKSIIVSSLDTSKMRGAGSTGYKEVLIIKDSVEITFGGFSHKFVDSPILRLTDINGDGIAGIIGNEFVSNKVLFIDNELSKMRIGSEINVDNYDAEIPFDYVDDRIYFSVDIQIDEDKIITPRLMLDLGCADGVILNTPYSNKMEVNKLPQSINYTILFGGAVGGNSDGGEFRASSLSFHGIELENPIICFSKDTLGAFSKTNYDGLIGNDIFDRFNYAIDYLNHKLYLKKNSNINKLFTTTSTGFYANKIKDIAQVQSIYYESEAYKNGLELGDTIVSINNKKISNLSEKEFSDELKGDGKHVSLVLSRKGKLIEVSFKIGHLL